MLRTQPEGARVYVNNEYLGESPVEYSDTRIVGSTNEVRFELEGHQPKVVHFSRDEEVDVLAVVAGIYLIVPLLWVMDYKDEHLYELQPLAGVINYIEAYSEAAGSIELGDPKEEVLAVLEPTQAAIDARGRREPERYIDDNEVLVEIYYFRSRVRPDASLSDEDFTPYLFRDRKLVGIGWSALGKPPTE